MNTSTVIAEVARLTAVANEKFPGHVFIVPTVRFASLGRRAGRALLDRNTIEINSDLLAVRPDQIIKDTVPHEVAHLIHYALRPWDFFKGSRLGHGLFWRMIARKIGLANPTRCFQLGPNDDDARAALGIKPLTLHTYKCAICGTIGRAGPRQHAKLKRGGSFLFVKCRHPLTFANYVEA